VCTDLNVELDAPWPKPGGPLGQLRTRPLVGFSSPSRPLCPPLDH
jgi:hypothetical protein